jgi:hypothetical protein
MAERNKRRRNRRRRGNGGAPQEKEVQQPVRPLYTPADHPARTFMPPKAPVRDFEPDPISGEEIKNPLTAIAHPQTGKPMNIETVLKLLNDSEEVQEGKELAYIGAGAFGIIEYQKEHPKFQVLKKIPYEDTHQTNLWRKELSPGISRDYTPKPEPLDRLYSQEEIQNFPKLGASAAVYLPKS